MHGDWRHSSMHFCLVSRWMCVVTFMLRFTLTGNSQWNPLDCRRWWGVGRGSAPVWALRRGEKYVALSVVQIPVPRSSGLFVVEPVLTAEALETESCFKKLD
jgi:hypothetical protein